MYRYGDGTPFPLDENFIETLTAAVECCTNAFDAVTELDGRRERARDGRRDADRESARLEDLEKSLTTTLTQYIPGDKKAGATQTVAQKVAGSAKQAITEAKRTIDARVHALEQQATARTIADAMLKSLRPFFDVHQLPKATWIMSWDVRGNDPSANAVATAGRLAAMFQLAPDPYRAPIRVEQLSENIRVHMLKRGVFGKAKAAPIDLGKYVVVAFERSTKELVVTLREGSTKAAPGLRFAITDGGAAATWTSISTAGDAEGEANPLDSEDLPPIKLLIERANATLKDLLNRRTLVDLAVGGTQLSDLDEPRSVPVEMLGQLTPIARTIRERSRMSGELILKRDIGDGRREELFVPRSTLAQQFSRLPGEYRRHFEEMGISGEATSPAITLPRDGVGGTITSAKPPPPPMATKRGPLVDEREEPTIEVKKD
jgi:hypothetical protein